MKKVSLFLDYGTGPIWTWNEEDKFYSPGIPDEYLSNEELVEMDKYIGDKYVGLFVNNKHEFSYRGFKTKEESQKFLEELKHLSDLVKRVLGDEYEVVDDFPYAEFEKDPEVEARKKKNEKRRERRHFLRTEEKAKKGDVAAMKELYFMLYSGCGSEYSPKKAVYWLKKIAKTKDPEALVELGRHYFFGEEVKKDRRKAFDCFKESADLGSGEACSILGDTLYYGEKGVEKDKMEAMKWYEKGMENGHPYCTFAFGRAHEEALDEPDYLKAMECYYKATCIGHDESPFAIGRLYEKGWGVKKDYERSLFYYQVSAGLGSESGFYGLGHAYMEGLGTEPDYEKGMKYLIKSEMEGYYRASYFIGMYYKLGKGVEQNDEYAFAYFKSAHYNGSWGGDLELGLCYEEGRGCKKNLFKAFGLVKASADMDFAPACLEMGRYYHEGIGTEKDDFKAEKYLRRAVAKKAEGSYEYLASFYKEKGDYEKAESVMTQKSKDEATTEYSGEYYRHKDPIILFDFYRYALSYSDSYPFSEAEEHHVDYGPLLLAVVEMNAPEVLELIKDHFYHDYMWYEGYENPEYHQERTQFYKEILMGKEIHPTIFKEDEVEGDGPYKNAAIALGEWLYTRIDQDSLEDKEASRKEFIDYLNLLSKGLRYMAEDFRELRLYIADKTNI